MRCTQSDIVFAVSKLSQWCQNSAVHHQTAVDWVMQYLKEMSELDIVYKREGLIDYSDSVYTDDWCDWWLTNETVFLSEKESFIWYSWKQKITVTSITKVKYISLSNTGKVTVWVRSFLHELWLHEMINELV